MPTQQRVLDRIARENANMNRIVRPGVVHEFANMVRSLKFQPLADAERWALLSEYILSQEPGYLAPTPPRE
jgi:hypothetical protein